MMWVLLLSVVTVASAVTRTGLRWDVKESDGWLVKSLSDGKSLLTLEFNPRGELVQCWTNENQDVEDAVAFMFYTATSDKSASRKDAVIIDLKNVTAACKAYYKNIFRNDNLKLRNEIQAIDALRDGFEGTRFCGFYPRSSLSSKLAIKREDKCCRVWHECALAIPAYGYTYTLWNYRPYSLLGCNCTAELRECLMKLETDLAQEILQTLFEDYTPKCITVTRKQENCLKWDDFFHRCLEWGWENYAQIVNGAQYLKAYQEGTTDANVLNKAHDEPEIEDTQTPTSNVVAEKAHDDITQVPAENVQVPAESVQVANNKKAWASGGIGTETEPTNPTADTTHASQSQSPISEQTTTVEHEEL